MAEITEHPFNGTLAPPGIIWFLRGVGLALFAAEKWTWRKKTQHKEVVSIKMQTVPNGTEQFASLASLCTSFDMVGLSHRILLWTSCNTWLIPSLINELNPFGMCSFYICLEGHAYILISTSSFSKRNTKWCLCLLRDLTIR